MTDRGPLELRSQQAFYDDVMEMLLSLVRLSNEAAALELERVPQSELEGRTLWEIGFDSALMVELVLYVEELGVELPDELPWATLTLADLYSIYTKLRIEQDLGLSS